MANTLCSFYFTENHNGSPVQVYFIGDQYVTRDLGPLCVILFLFSSPLQQGFQSFSPDHLPFPSFPEARLLLQRFVYSSDVLATWKQREMRFFLEHGNMRVQIKQIGIWSGAAMTTAGSMRRA